METKITTPKDRKKANELNEKLKFLHKLLGKEFDDDEFRRLNEMYIVDYEIKYNKEKHIQSVSSIRDIILDKVV